MMKISVSTDISVLGFYGYIGYIDGYFYMNIDISEIKLDDAFFNRTGLEHIGSRWVGLGQLLG